MKRRFTPWKVSFFLCALAWITAGCGQTAAQGGTFAWIDVPVNDLTFPLGQEIRIEGHASDPTGVSRVEIWVNQELTWTVEDLPSSGDFVRFSQTWTPPEEGDYFILAAASGNGGESSTPASVIVHVGRLPAVALVTEESIEAPDPATPTPEPALPETVVQFWADPPQIEADSCTLLRWQVENAEKVVLGSSEVSKQGSYEVCLCESTSYSLTVTGLDGIAEEFKVSIPVSGICAPPTVEIDESPPPAPVLLKPLDGSDLDPVADTILRWNAVSDESGIAQYQVQVQRHSGDYNWTAAPGNPWTGLGETQLLLNVEYGYTYRWRVRAVDGAGNTGPWSGWFTFVVPLT
jgi:hypothetical protein